MSVDSHGRISETDLASLSEYDRFSLDDAGTDCSCSSCSSCSTCSMCEEEDGACGSSCGEDEYFEEENGSCHTEDVQTVSNGRVVGRRAMRFRNGKASLNTKVDQRDSVTEGTREFPEERLLQFSSHWQGKEELIEHKLTNPHVEVNAGIQENHSFSNGMTTIPLQTLRLEELSFQEGGVKNPTGWSNGLSVNIHDVDHDKKRKKVTFIDSSSSSDEVMFTEQFSMSSDNSASGWSPCLCSAKGDIVRHGGKSSPGMGANEKQRGVRISAVDMNLEYGRLKNVLKTIDPLKLHTILKHALKTKRCEAIDALATLLPKSKFTADTIHCVRCHKEFDPIYGKKQCALPHPEKSVLKVSQDSEGADFECSVCESSFRLKGAWDYRPSANDEQNCGVCFLGKHTPNTEEVEFGASGAAQSCEDKGCIVFYV